MFNVGGGEIMVILLLALLVLGPEKLPEYTRKAGRYINEFRRMTSGFQEEFRSAIDIGDLLSPPSTEAPAAETPAASTDDALDRTTEGPRLQPEEPTGPTPVEPPTTAPIADAAAPAPASDPAPRPVTAFSADVTPAPGTGPELITPSRPSVDRPGDTGSSSAA